MYTPNFSYRIKVILISCLLGVFLTGNAQEPEDSTVTYPASFFAQYDVVTVNDMLNRIPGISLALNANGTDTNRGPSSNTNNRGLGGDAQILVDGKRMAGKTNEAASQLNRIAASQVDYIEIIRGSSGDLDVSNTGQIINIVLIEQSSRSTVSADINMTSYRDGSVEPGGSLAYSGQTGRLNYLFSLEVKPGLELFESIENSINGDISPNDRIFIDREKELTTYTLNSTFNFNLSDADRLTVNTLYSEADPPSKLTRRITNFNTGAPVDRFESEDIPATENNWEIGIDYEHRFANNTRFKLLSIFNDVNKDTTRERFFSSSPQDRGVKNLYLDNNSRTRERIVRSSYTMSLTESQSLELGIERAQTILDSSLKMGLNLPGITDIAFGGLVPVTLPIADSTVEEIRYEGFVVHNWQINARSSLESSFLFEASEIEQTGDAQNKRDFTFPKPKFSYRFDINQSTQFRATVEKFISQLSFADFTANTEDRDDDQDTLGGNPELAQEEWWRYTLNLEYRLPQDGGVLNSRLFFFDVGNAIGRIDASPSENNLQTINGNVGDGTILGLDLDASIRLGFIGVPDAVLTAGALVQESKINDPLIGFERKVVPFDRGNYRLGFRHDVTSRNFNYGFNYRDGINGNRPFWDIDKVQFLGSRSDLTLFFETRGFGGLTYRFESINSLDHESCGVRRRYAGRLLDGVLREIEENCRTVGRQFALKIRGTF
jgi:outer membrane receptor for ferrienterochelin and colicins